MQKVEMNFARHQSLTHPCSTSAVFVRSQRIVLESSLTPEDFTMSTKPRWVAVTDPTEADTLASKDRADLSAPITFAPNGLLWVEAEELARWRAFQKGAEHG